MELPASPAEPFEYRLSPGETLTLETAVFQSLGAASTCWDEAGVFESERAKAIGEKLLQTISELACRNDGSNAPEGGI